VGEAKDIEIPFSAPEESQTLDGFASSNRIRLSNAPFRVAEFRDGLEL
jgi:hypothetical protein